MGVARTAIAALTACRPLSRPLLRGYLRAGGIVPERGRWVAARLKRELTPGRSARVVGIGDGLRLSVDPNGTIGREIYFHGSYEPDLVRFLRRSLGPGMVVIDAGANLGELTVRAARLVGPGGAVVAIEAAPATLENLRHNVALNKLANVRVVAAAVGESDDPQTFFLGSEEDSLTSSLSPPHDFEGKSVTVEGIRIDRLAGREGLGRLDLIKLDVEGAELAALRGAGEILARWAPLVVFEYNHEVAQRAGWDLLEVAELLRPLGYSLHELGARGLRPLLAGELIIRSEGLAKVDVVAVPRSRGGR